MAVIKRAFWKAKRRRLAIYLVSAQSKKTSGISLISLAGKKCRPDALLETRWTQIAAEPVSSPGKFALPAPYTQST